MQRLFCPRKSSIHNALLDDPGSPCTATKRQLLFLKDKEGFGAPLMGAGSWVSLSTLCPGSCRASLTAGSASGDAGLRFQRPHPVVSRMARLCPSL